MHAIRLRTEHLQNPMGIDVTTPMMHWNCAEGLRQTAFQLKCTDAHGALLWDSGKQTGAQMRVRYAGKPLCSRTHVRWQVRLWDENDMPGAWSEEAFFELGLLRPEDWQAGWITGDYRPRRSKRYPVDSFRKELSCENVAQARLYITACGVYEACLNGQRVGHFILAPGITDYRKRIQYQTYDVTELLLDGINVLEVQLADGWYRGSTGAWGVRNQYGEETALLCQLEITHRDGRVTTLCSDDTWQWCSDGPIREADNKDGEVVDARMQPTYTGHAKRTRRRVVPSASNNVPVTEHETFKPTVIHTPGGKTVLDFGQNLAGYVHFRLRAKAGQRVSLRFGEMLDSQGEFTQENIQLVGRHKTTPLQRIDYTCRDGVNEYKTRFSIFGFRYALLDTDAAWQPEDFTAIAVYSDMENTLTFDSSNPLLNRFVECTRWSAKNNAADLPTDCPTRERHGWTGDAQIFFGTASYLFDYAGFARKYLHDVYDWQRRDGCLPQIAPAGGVDFYMYTLNGSVGWADAGVIIPYRYWKQYGDDSILHEFYPGMQKYARFMMKRCGRLGLLAKPLGLKGKARKYAVNAGQSYGEWAEPAEVYPNRWTDMVAPHPEVSTAYTAYVMGLMAEIAAHLGDPEGQTLYSRYHEGCRKAYQALVRKPEFSLDTDRQACLVRPLAFGLLDDAQTEYARKRLIQAIEHYGWRLGTGFLSTPLILDVLAQSDIEAAYRLLENEKMPGWLFMPKMGATTVWESWEGTEAQNGIASLNHYSKGAVCEWLFRVMCGIRMANEPNTFHIEPRPGGHFTHASTVYQSMYGEVSCAWERQEGSTVFTLCIPANTMAYVRLPNGQKMLLSAGEHVLTIEHARPS